MTARTVVLAVRLSALGDVIHTIPAVVALRKAMPESEIRWVVEAPYAELVATVAGVESIPASLKKWPGAPRRHRRQIADFWRRIRGVDVAIDFQGLIKSALIARFSGAPQRFGFDRNAIREKPAALFTNHHVRIDRSMHVIEWNLALARAVAPGATMPDVDFAPFADSSTANRQPSSVNARPSAVDRHPLTVNRQPTTMNPQPETANRIVLLPGAGRGEKLWPVNRFAELARLLGDRALVVWGPGEEALARAIGADLAPPTNLRELAAILAGAALVVGGDTGPLHLAAALRTKTVGLYGPTNPRRNGPYGQLDRCISTFDTTKRMDSIAVRDVMEQIERTLAE